MYLIRTPVTTITPSVFPSTSQLPTESSVPSLAPTASNHPSLVPSTSFAPSMEPTLVPSTSLSPSEYPSAPPSIGPTTSSEPSETPSLSADPTGEPSHEVGAIVCFLRETVNPRHSSTYHFFLCFPSALAIGYPICISERLSFCLDPAEPISVHDALSSSHRLHFAINFTFAKFAAHR